MQKLYDTSTIEMISKNNPSFLNQMIVMFVDLVSKDFEALKVHAANDNWKEVGLMAHKIKSAAGNMGVNSILPFIKALELGVGDRVENLKGLEEGLANVMAAMKHDFPQLFK
jgi:HPt (histidine-containing phosphotransfer) domain-containing protein